MRALRSVGVASSVAVKGEDMCPHLEEDVCRHLCERACLRNRVLVLPLHPDSGYCLGTALRHAVGGYENGVGGFVRHVDVLWQVPVCAVVKEIMSARDDTRYALLT